MRTCVAWWALRTISVRLMDIIRFASRDNINFHEWHINIALIFLRTQKHWIDVKKFRFKKRKIHINEGSPSIWWAFFFIDEIEIFLIIFLLLILNYFFFLLRTFLCFQFQNLCTQIGNINFLATKIHSFLDSTK